MSQPSTSTPSSPSHTNDRMSAMVLHRYGPPENLELATVQRPACGQDQVVIRVRAAAINPIDWRIRNGSLRFILPAKFPLVLGYDVAGEVAESRSALWKTGDEVYAFLNNRHGGGYAEYAVGGPEGLARKPSSLSFEEAAAVPLAALTALQALRDLARIQPGHNVLVNGASGGVGTFAVQVAVALGARVTAVCSADNSNLVRDLGAERVVDHRREDFTRGNREYDIVFDAVAKSAYWKCRQVLKSHGAYVTTVPSATSILFRVLGPLFGPSCRTILVRPSSADLEIVSGMIEAGVLRPVVQQVYPLRELASAHRASEAGHVVGKLVLAV